MVAMMLLNLKFAVILVGFFIGIHSDSNEITDNSSEILSLNLEEYILNQINVTRLRENLKFLTRNPHLAGSVYNNDLANHIAESWKSFGFDSVTKVPYNVLLSYPNSTNPNKIQLINNASQVVFTSRFKEDVLRVEDDHPDFVHFYNSFASNGTVEGELVYANFATVQDFQELARLGVDVKGKVVIAQYGIIYRGNKVYLAAQAGAVGIILYNDPYSNAQEGQEPEHVYPFSWWLQGSGAQRGSIKSLRGDSQTPMYPSLEGVYRTPVDQLNLPKIPCQPISYDDAGRLLTLLDGQVMPEKWQKLTNFTRKIGPGFAEGQPIRMVRLTVNNYLKPTNITNVVGIIRGSTEPDRYVIAGNHRDAWGFGAVDPSSGTSQMLEVTKALGKLLERGWRPRRTIVFCSWDAEEFGLIGSYEWVEDNLVKLAHRAVVYINTDSCASGGLFSPNSSPLLYHLLINVSKQIQSPVNGSVSLYETWLEDAIAYRRINDRGEIVVPGPKGGTDHVPFAYFAGVPSINLAFRDETLRHRVPLSTYPTYHTGFDTFYMFDQFIDNNYFILKTCSSLNGLLLTRLADANILPFNVTHYALNIIDAFDQVKADGIYDLIANKSLNIDLLDNKINVFYEAALDWEGRLRRINVTSDILYMRGLNDQLTQLEQTLLNTNGLPGQPQYRHLIFALGTNNMYGSSSFPGLRDLAYEIMVTPKSEVAKLEELWTLMARHLSDLIVALHSATAFIKPLHVI